MRYILILGLSFFAAASMASETEVFSGAEWIRDPVFADVPVLNLFHREFEPKPETSGPTHVHTLFRKEIILDRAPASATLYITGDDYYKFYHWCPN